MGEVGPSPMWRPYFFWVTAVVLWTPTTLHAKGLHLMRFLISILLALVLMMPAAAREPMQPTDAVLIRNVTAIDAKNGVRAGVDILIKGQRIAEIRESSSDKAGQPSLPPTIHEIDGAGKFLIPGLWDTHVHLTYDPLLNEDIFFSLAIAHGVTSLRDIGGHLNLLSSARSRADKDPLAPNLFVSGPLIDGGQRIYDGHARGYPDLSVSATSPDEARKIVDQLAAQGVDFVKAYEMLQPEVFNAVVERARKHGLRVSAHVPLGLSASQVARMEGGDIQHLRNLELACSTGSEALLALRIAALASAPSGKSPAAIRSEVHRKQRPIALTNQDEARCAALAALMAKNRVYQTPTLTVSTFFGYRLFARDSWRQTWSMMPTEVADRWMAGAQNLSRRPLNPANEAYTSWALGMTKRLHDAGVPIMAGTDAPIGYLTPGISLHEELAFLVRAGLTPLEAIEAATLTPARFFDLDTELGSIEPGMRADLVLLRANPIDHISNTTAIDVVVKDGHVLGQKTISTLKECCRSNGNASELTSE